MVVRNFECEFISIFNTISNSSRRFEVFSDFVKIVTLSLFNLSVKNEELRKEHIDLFDKYSHEDMIKLNQLFDIVVDALTDRPQDFLGEIFMKLDFGEIRKGQFFTPYYLSLCMAKIQMGSGMLDTINKKGFVRVLEPSCGSGSMIIALYESLLEIEYNPQECMWVQCIDVDSTVAMMCYIQLSLLFIPGVVIIGDTLSSEMKRAFYTPAHIVGEWENKLSFLERVEKMQSFICNMKDNKSDQYVGEKNIIIDKSDNLDDKNDTPIQISFF